MPRTRAPKLPEIPEAEVLKGCLGVLADLGVFAWRNNSGATVGEHRGKRRFIRYGKPGSSDILGQLPKGVPGRGGALLAVETKRRGNKPTDLQMNFLRKVNESGGIGLWVDDVRVFAYAMERILAGAWVVIDEDGRPWITDEERP